MTTPSLPVPESLRDRLPVGFAANTAAKVIASVSIRMPYVFLATIASGLNSSVGHLGALLGIAELAGLASFLIGRSIDRGAVRMWLFAGLGMLGAGLVVMATAKHAGRFALGFGGVTMGVSMYTTASHAWIGREVPFHRRGEVIGLFETSWAIAILLGAPLVGLLIAATSWNWPWAVMAALFVPLGYWLYRTFPYSTITSTYHVDLPPFRLTRAIGLTLLTTSLMSFGATAVFSTYGAWLEDRFELSVRTIGLLSIVIGVAELVASSATVRFSDAWGKTRCAIGGLATMALGALAITVVPKVTALGVGALVLVFLGFEFALLCMLSIVSEVGAENRGTVISVNAALSTLARAGAAALGTGVYAAAGMPSASLMTLFCCVVAISGVVGARLHNGGQPVRKLV